MADKKISQLPVASSLASADVVPVVQGGVTKQAALSLTPYLPAGTGAVATTVQAKLRESVSVKDFGFSASNSAAANKIALQVAISSFTRPGRIYIPQGIYNIAPNISLTGSLCYGIYGDGKYATQLSIVGAGTNFFVSTTTVEYFELCQLGMFSASVINGFNCATINHSLFENLLFTGFSGACLRLGGYSNDIVGCDMFLNTGSGIIIGGTCNNNNIVRNRIFSNSGIGVLINPSDPDAGLQINIEQNGIEQNALAGVVAYNTKGMNICNNYFERNANIGYAYSDLEALTVRADIHLLANNSQVLATNPGYANQGPSITGNQTTPNGSAGFGTSYPDFTFVFTNYAQNLTIENNQVFSISAALFNGIISLYTNSTVSSIVGPLTLSGNSLSKVAYVGTYSLTQAHSTSHLIRDSTASLANYAPQNWLSWSVIAGTTGSWYRAAFPFLNQQGWYINNAGTPSTAISMGFALSITANPELANKWVWFGCWVNTLGASSNAQLTIGSQSQINTTTYDTTNGYVFKSVLVQLPASGIVYPRITNIGANGIYLANPILTPVGGYYADFPVNSIVWSRAGGVVSDGTWAVGDRIFNSTPVVGQPKSWVNTVAGFPGTFVSEGNL